MGYKNMRELLVGATQLPAAIEKMLPEGAPKLSTRMIEAANKIPEGPGFPIEIPNLPAPPAFTPPGGGAALGRYVSEVREVGAPGRATPPAAPRRGAARFLY